ncbi:Mob1/phocein family protein [Entamoeba marina]
MFSKKIKTMKPKKKIPKNTLRYDLHKTIKEGISKGTIKDAVKCPNAKELNEWLAVNCFDFFNNILLIYSAVSDLCSPTACPIMSGGPSMEYLWSENKKSVQLPAREYCEKLFEWVQHCFDNTKIFPDVFGSKPPKHFMSTITKIFKRLFRVYAHMFYSHQDHLKELKLNDQAYLGFRHYYVYCREFNMLSKDDVSPLEQMIDPIDKEFNLKKLN